MKLERPWDAEQYHEGNNVKEVQICVNITGWKVLVIIIRPHSLDTHINLQSG
jgi:hypothetical protein